MKKLTALLLAVMLVMTMSTTAFAATITTAGGYNSADVTGTYVTGSAGSTVYSVDIVWGSMAFTYTGASEGTWNPATHTYYDATEAGWSCEDGANKITVTNHSNDAVAAEFVFYSYYDDTDGAFYSDKDRTTALGNNDSLLLNTAVGTEATAAPSGDVYFYITDGSYTTAGNPATIGQIVLTINSQTKSSVTFNEAFSTIDASDNKLATASIGNDMPSRMGFNSLFNIVGLYSNVQISITNQTTGLSKTDTFSAYDYGKSLYYVIYQSGVGTPSSTENTVYVIALTGTDNITRTLTLTVTAP